MPRPSGWPDLVEGVGAVGHYVSVAFETATPQAGVIRLIGHLPIIYIIYRAREKKTHVVPGRKYGGLVYILNVAHSHAHVPYDRYISH